MVFGLENSFFTFYYPPDLSAGSFRAIALVQALSERMKDNDELHIITTHPNRYENHRVKADNVEIHGNITVHRISVPSHKSGMFSQVPTFITYALASYRLSNNLNPDFEDNKCLVLNFDSNQSKLRFFW